VYEAALAVCGGWWWGRAAVVLAAVVVVVMAMVGATVARVPVLWR
jgi:hypothetical protein